MNKLTITNLNRRISEILWVLLLTALSSTELQALERGNVTARSLMDGALLAEIDLQSVTTDIYPKERASDSDAHAKQTTTYGPIKRSDTLWSIATRVRPDKTVSMEQVMLSIVTANPEAFENNNSNILKKGVLLTIPSKSQMLVVPKRRAYSEVEKQHQIWDGIKSRIAGKKKPSTRYKSIAKTKPGKMIPKIMVEVDPRLNEIIAVLKSDNSQLKEALKHLSEGKTTNDKAYKNLQITHKQLLARHGKLVKEYESLATEVRSKLDDQNNNISEASDSKEELINENSALRARVEQLDGEYAFLNDKFKTRNNELSELSKEFARYKKLSEKTKAASETAVMMDEWISTPAIFNTLLGILLLLLLLPWLLLMRCKRTVNSSSSKDGKSGLMGRDQDDDEELDDLEQKSISESDLENMLSDSDKVETKLDLARAYIDMGDFDGAKSILEGVLSEGSAQQQQEAEEILSKL